MADKHEQHVAEEQPLISHLIELRNRLLHCVLAVLLIFGAFAVYSNEIYTFLAGPLLSHLPDGATMIATDVASPFFAPIKLAMVAAVFAAMPYVLYQAWAFVAPGLYSHERKFALPLLIASVFLFYAGMAFAYFVVFPLIFGFFTSTAPEGVAVMTDIGKYLDFVLTLFFAFGIAFQVPVATILLVSTGMVTPDWLREKRPYIIVGAFVIGAILTPPDVWSQTLLAVPMWMLFEIGLFFSTYVVKAKQERERAEEDMDSLLDRYEADESTLNDRKPD